MKAFYLTASIVLTVLILILAFENIGATFTDLNFLIYDLTDTSPILVILGISVIGILTGASYHAFMSNVLDSANEEDEAF